MEASQYSGARPCHIWLVELYSEQSAFLWNTPKLPKRTGTDTTNTPVVKGSAHSYWVKKGTSTSVNHTQKVL